MQRIDPQTAGARKVDCAEWFSRIVRALVNEMVARDPTDGTLERARNQLMIATREVPTRVIETAGPYLYRYREIILSPDPLAAERHLRSQSYQNEFDAAGPSENKDTSQYIMQRLRNWWHDRSEAEFMVFYPSLQEMTRVYLEYLLLTKGVAPRPRERPELKILDKRVREQVRRPAA